MEIIKSDELEFHFYASLKLCIMIIKIQRNIIAHIPLPNHGSGIINKYVIIFSSNFVDNITNFSHILSESFHGSDTL